MQKTAVVLGRNYTSRLGMIRAAGLAGCDVIAIHSVNRVNVLSIDGSSKYINKYYKVVEGDDQKLLSTLKEIADNTDEKRIIIPTDDNTAFFVDKYRKELANDFLMPRLDGEYDSIVYYMDKERQKGFAVDAGLKAPKSWTIEKDNNKFVIPDNIEYPCFVKPQVSIKGAKRIMEKCSSEDELKELLKKAINIEKQTRSELMLMAEQFINIENEYDVPGFADGENVYLPLFIQKGLLYKGVTATGRLIESSEFQEIHDALVKMISKIEFTGLIDIELLESNGEIYFNELNMRFGASGFAATGAGVNLPKIFIDRLLGNRSLTDSLIPNKRTFASEKVCFQKYAAKEMSWKEYRRTLKNNDFTFIKSYDDPAPYKEFKKQARIRRSKILVKRILKRGR